MISMEEARAFVFGQIRVLDPVDVPVDQCVGCVAADDLYATEAVPGFANSSMDGFALRASDTGEGPVHLRVVDAILAGGSSRSRVGPGEAMRIMTGARVPEGADSVEMIEEVDLNPAGDVATIKRSIPSGTFVRHPGDDIKVGDQLLGRGDVLHATRVGVLASQGTFSVHVYPRPRVGVLSTGNEVTVAPGPLAVGAIRDVNRPLLLALIEDTGAIAVDLGVVRDDASEIRRVLAGAAERCDVVVTTGGVSVGDVDFVKVVIGELAGKSARSMQVAMRPGKPFAFGVVGERAVPIFGLPGNPVSTRVSFEIFVRPSIRRRAGHAYAERLGVDAVTDVAVPRTPDGRTHLVHVLAMVRDDGRVHVVSTTREGSHLLHAVASANAIAIVPDGDGVRAGENVRLIVLHPEEMTSASAPGR